MYKKYLKYFRNDLPIGESFDILERKLKIGGRKAHMFFTDGLTDGEKTQRILSYLMRVPEESMEDITTSQRLLEEQIPFLDSNLVTPKGISTGLSEHPDKWTEEMVKDCCAQAEEKMYSGLTPLVVEGLDKIVFLNEGRVEAVGPHDQLYTSCPEYRRMVDLQRLEDETKGGENA